MNIKEGWGLAQRKSNADGKPLLYVSDSTSKLKEIDPTTWTLVREIEVRNQDGSAVPFLNELEIITTTPLTSMYVFAN